jgi:hypothetical protein
MQRREILASLGVGIITLSSGCVKAGAGAADEAGKLLGPLVRSIGEGSDSNDTPQTETPESDGLTPEGTQIDLDSPDKTLIRIEEEVEIDGGSYTSWELNLGQYSDQYDLNASVEYSLIVRQGGEINAIFMEKSEFAHFRQGERYQYDDRASSMGVVDVSHDAIIGWKDQQFVIENPNLEKVQVEIELAV